MLWILDAKASLILIILEQNNWFLNGVQNPVFYFGHIHPFKFVILMILFHFYYFGFGRIHRFFGQVQRLIFIGVLFQSCSNVNVCQCE